MRKRLTLSGRLRRLVCAFAWLAAALAVAPGQAATPGSDATGHPMDHLVLYVPAPEGGGWEQTALAMKATLEAEGLAREVEVVRRPGGGGLVGLAQFVEAHRGDPRFLLVGGLGMIYSAKVNESAVTPLNTTPIARLARDYYVIAVPAQSPLHNAADLLAALRSQPDALHWAGDQPSGAVQQMIWQVVATAHVDARSLSYAPQFGAREVATLLQQGDPALVGVLGYGELAPALAGGGIRVLGVAAPDASFAGISSLRAQGLDVVSANWRAVFAPPGIRPDQRQRLIVTMASMARSPIWRGELRRRGWDDCFLAGGEFTAFVADEQQRIFLASALPTHAPDDKAISPQSRPIWFWPGLAAMLAALLAVVLGYGTWRSYRAARRSAKVQATLGPVDTDQPADRQAPVVTAINGEFDAWKLSAAERDVAWFLLKGLPMKEIARLRGASERTVRQQARAIYSKAGLDGRSDLAAHILNECLAPAFAPATGPKVEA